MSMTVKSMPCICVSVHVYVLQYICECAQLLVISVLWVCECVLFFVCVRASRVSSIDPPMAECIISRERIYNLGGAYKFREQAMEVSGRAWGSGESSATGHRSIWHLLALHRAVRPSSRPYKWPRTQTPGHHHRHTPPSFLNGTRARVSCRPTYWFIALLLPPFPIQSMCTKPPEPIFKG